MTNQWDAWSAWGSDLQGGPHPIRTWKMGSGGASESHWDWESGIRDLGLRDDEAGCWDLRAGWPHMGRQLLVPKGEKRTLSLYLDILKGVNTEGKSASLATSHDLGNVHDYELHRMLLGVPEGPKEILPGQALPLESCMDIHGGGKLIKIDGKADSSVDFRKGCYLGQELTVRTYHTGATRKRILPIRLIPLDQSSSSSISDLLSFSPQQSLAEVDIPLDITYHPPSTSATRKPRSAGKILSLHNAVGLALVRLEMAERCWWSGDIRRSSVSQWLDSGAGKLTTKVNGKKWGVYVGQGEAYAAALEHMPSSS